MATRQLQLAVLVALAAMVLCGVPAHRRVARGNYDDDEDDDSDYDVDIEVEHDTSRSANGSVQFGDCNVRGAQLLLQDVLSRCALYNSHVSTVLTFDARGHPRDCNVTCVDAESRLVGEHTPGNVTVSEGGIGQSHIKLKFMSAYQQGYDYLVRIRGTC